MTNQKALLESYVHLCEPQYKLKNTDSYGANWYSLTFDTDLYCFILSINFPAEAYLKLFV